MVGTELACQTEARATGCRTVCLLLVLLTVLESLQDPSGLALVKGAILLPFNRQDPPSLDEVLRPDLSHIDQLKDLVLQPGLVLCSFCLCKLLLVGSLVRGADFLPRSIRSGEEGLFIEGLTKNRGESSTIAKRLLFLPEDSGERAFICGPSPDLAS